MSATLESTLAIVPQITAKQIVPQDSQNLLNPPFNDLASFNPNQPSNDMIFTCSLMVPVKVQVSSDNGIIEKGLSAQIYYSKESGSELDIYLIYEYTSDTNDLFQQYEIQVSINPEMLPLREIKTINSLVVNDDPKTSRRTVTTVRSTSGI